MLKLTTLQYANKMMILQQIGATAGIKVHVAGVYMGVHHTNAGSTAISGADKMVAKMDQWRALAVAHGTSIEAMAVAFAALPSCVSKVVLGMKSVGEVEANIQAAADSASVPVAIWAEAQAAGLIRADVVLPQ